jgi:plasmid stability protein
MSSTYLLRDVADDLWKRVKVRAAREELSIREVILQLLTYYAKHGLPESE